VTELSGSLWLIAGLAGLAATGGLVASCLRLRSPIEFLLATYLVAWTWLIVSSLALSPFQLLSRSWLFLALILGLGLAAAAWIAVGHPRPPDFGPALAATRDALRNPAVLILGVAVALGIVYSGALAFLTPVNEWDALSYHLPRADFWMQEHGLGYIDNTADSRLNVNPPNAEIAELATMSLSGSDRYVAIGQLLAYCALALGVAGLSRRIGLSVREALFAAFAFSTLAVIALQASGALNDLVLASFLTAAAYFALGTGGSTLLPIALAIALAIGTKFTGLLALPVLALVAAVGRPVRRWPGLVLAGVGGLAAGSIWYVVNIVETGEVDGGAAGEFDQRVELGVATLIAALRLALSFVDMSGSPWPDSLLFVVAAGVLAGAGLLRLRSARAYSIPLLAAAAITAGVVAYPLIFRVGVRPIYKAGLVLGAPSDFLKELSWALNTNADPTFSWYGPLAPLLLVAAAVIVVLAWRRGKLPPLALTLAAAPWVLIITVALTLTWDPWRGRFLIFGVALAAATWGVLLRFRSVAMAAAAIGSTALLLSLANQTSKPSGLFSEPSIWGDPRWEAQTRLSGPRDVLRFVEENVPENAQIGVSLTGNHHLHPYFGPKLSRHVALVPYDGGIPPADTEWLVLAPETRVRRCDGSWRPQFSAGGWRVEQRLAPDTCLSG
jgi:hypothetical protein